MRSFTVRGPVALAAAPSTITWDPASTAAIIDLTNGNLTATGNAGASGADGRTRGTGGGATTGKKYWEYTVGNTASGTFAPGICNGSLGVSSNLGTTVNGLQWDKDGNILVNGGVVTTIQGYNEPDTICIALDLDNAKIWCRTNGGNWNNSATADPATNTEGIAQTITGTIFPGFSPGTVMGDNVTVNFGATAYAQTVPSGFTNW